MASVAELSLKEARKIYPKASIVKVNYKGHIFHYCTLATLGEGTFGKVLKGWKKDGVDPLAIKIIGQVHLQDWKSIENMEREVDILKRMKGCENVVQMYIAAQVKEGVIIAMEMCDGDLSGLLSEKKSFSRKEAVDFLHQLGEGMKELRKQNIVHRDIKPQNILIKNTDQKTIFKLADFGYARHFDANRTKVMNSVVGTPLYMAPEALEVYLYPHKQSYYTDKVDVWSIGALLYKVLAGKDAFPANSIDGVYKLLRNKRDNIAFELPGGGAAPVFLDELPESVQKRLTPVFSKTITSLLVGTLKFDQKERLSFPIFFQKIDDIIESKVELINLLHGTSFKLIQDSTLTPSVLREKAASTWSIPQEEVVIFSTEHPKYVASHQPISGEEFSRLLEKSGGSQGHVRLYVMNVNEIRTGDNLTPDTSCFNPLKSALDKNNTEHLVNNLRFVEEIIYMVNCMREQLQNQLKSVETLFRFSVHETGMSITYMKFKKSISQALAQVSLMVEMLNKDIELGGAKAAELSLPELLKELVEKEGQLKDLEMATSIKVLCRLDDPFKMKDCDKQVDLCINMAKHVHVGNVPENCMKIYEFCHEMLVDKTNHTRLKLAGYAKILSDTWSLYSKESVVKDVSKLISQITSARQQMYQEVVGSTDKIVATPVSGTLRDYTSLLQGLREENEALRKQLSEEMNSSLKHKRKYDEAVADLQSSKLEKKEKELEDEGKKSLITYDKLYRQLAEFCKIGAQVARVRDSMVDKEDSEHSGGAGGVNEALLLKARDMATEIRDSIAFIRSDGIHSSEERHDIVNVKITLPDKYKAGDVVLMTPVNTHHSGSLPSILHLHWNMPLMLMNFKCLQPMKIRPGRVPQLFLAKLREDPQKLDLKNYPQTAQDIGQKEGIFYRATVDPVSVKFSSADLCLLGPEQQHHSLRSKSNHPPK